MTLPCLAGLRLHDGPAGQLQVPAPAAAHRQLQVRVRCRRLPLPLNEEGPPREAPGQLLPPADPPEEELVELLL